MTQVQVLIAGLHNEHLLHSAKKNMMMMVQEQDGKGSEGMGMTRDQKGWENFERNGKG